MPSLGSIHYYQRKMTTPTALPDLFFPILHNHISLNHLVGDAVSIDLPQIVSASSPDSVIAPV